MPRNNEDSLNWGINMITDTIPNINYPEGDFYEYDLDEAIHDMVINFCETKDLESAKNRIDFIVNKINQPITNLTRYDPNCWQITYLLQLLFIDDRQLSLALENSRNILACLFKQDDDTPIISPEDCYKKLLIPTSTNQSENEDRTTKSIDDAL